MGFSWSSAVAQHATLALCARAGVPADAVLSPDRPPPSNQQELCLVCTDDAIFLHRSREKGARTLQKYDDEATEAGVTLNRGKDVTLEERMTALGCDLTARPPRVAPAAAKLRKVIAAGLDLVKTRRCQARVFRAWLGGAQWFCLLERWLFSVFHKSYEFARGEPADKERDVPANVVQEVSLFLALAPFLTLPLDRQVYPRILACDAAPEYGFGVAEVACGRAEAEKLCRLAEKRGDYVRPSADPADPAEVPRAGTLHTLSMPQKCFRQVVGRRARWHAHSGSLEAHALLLAVRGLVRRAAAHRTRVPVLVDAKTVVCAAGKGRSSAPTIRHTIARIGAHVLAADLALRIVYVPSEANPADGPSRGRRPGTH